MPDTDILAIVESDLGGSLLSEGSLIEVISQTFLSDVAALDYVWLIGILVLFFFWVVVLIWVIKDSTARSDSFAFQLFAVLVVILFTPLLGLPLYVACRPQGFKWDKSPWREALLEKIQRCENCHALNHVDHTCCVYCGDRLTHECRECSQAYSLQYHYCPFCGAPNIER